MTGYIYIHTNKINGKKYIGQTIQKPEDRWGKNGNGYKNKQLKFYRAILKYGWNNFEHEIIPAYPEELDFLECEFIKKYDSVKNGYNSDFGGFKGCKIISEETREKFRLAKLGKKRGPLSKETKKKISDGNKGRYVPSERILSLKKYYETHNIWNRKKILNIDTNEIFDSIIDAAKKYGKSLKQNISKVCNGERKTAGGYHWQYVE